MKKQARINDEIKKLNKIKDNIIFDGNFAIDKKTIKSRMRKVIKLDSSISLSIDDEVENFGYGVSLGAGLRVSRQMEAFIRFDRGFSKVYPNNDRNNTYNRLLAVGVNYYLNENWW